MCLSGCLWLNDDADAGKSPVEWWNGHGIEGQQPAVKLKHTQNVGLLVLKIKEIMIKYATQ